MNVVTIEKGRVNTVYVSLKQDVSKYSVVSEIRVEPNSSSELIATWVASFKTNGKDGELVLTMDDSVSGAITQKTGYMDVKLVFNGDDVSAFDDYVPVLFKETVTA